jgi:hypothetical protein
MMHNSQNYWVFGLCPSSNIVKQIQFLKCCVLLFLEYWTMYKLQKPSNSVSCHYLQIKQLNHKLKLKLKVAAVLSYF